MDGSSVEESVMKARFVLVAATLISGSAFAAQPVKPASQPAAAPQNVSAPIVLASADDVRQPAATEQQAPTAPKRRIARVTTCRCGDAGGTADQ
jgi:hypothetical protein